MNLTLIRHAIAVEREPGSEQDDRQRPLSDQGRKKMKKIARGLKSLGLSFDLIWTSPLVRAVETAGILRTELGLPAGAVSVCRYLAPRGSQARLVAQINAQAGAAELALVGHEPDLSQLIAVLTTGSSGNLTLALKKGGVCRLSIEQLTFGRCATLEWLLTPAVLATLGD